MEGGLIEQRISGTRKEDHYHHTVQYCIDELDKELERRGHSFCRYADDCNIYVKSKKGRRKSDESCIDFMKRSEAKSNEQKSGVRHCS